MSVDKTARKPNFKADIDTYGTWGESLFISSYSESFKEKKYGVYNVSKDPFFQVRDVDFVIAKKPLYDNYDGLDNDKEFPDEFPDDMKDEYRKIFFSDAAEFLTEEEKAEEAYMRRLVKAADKLSALIKCIEEENSGNREFRTAMDSTQKSIEKMAEEMPELHDFMKDFLPSYGMTLDELE